MIQISTWSVFPAVIIGLFLYRKLNHDTRWIALLVIFASVPHIANYYEKLVAIRKEDSIRYVFYNVYMILELLLLSIYFNRFFISKAKKIVFKASIVFCAILGCFFFIKSGFTVFQTKWLSINNTIYTGWCLLLLYQLYKEDELDIQDSKSLLFYVFGILLYSSCTIFAIGLWEYLNENKESELSIIRSVHPIFNLVMYTLFSIGFIKEVQVFNSKKSTQNTDD